MENPELIWDFAIIMAVASATVVVFHWLRQPPVLGYLIAGLIVGPFTLPLFGVAAPISDMGGIRLMADAGLVLLLFALGMEFGWNRIRSLGMRVVLIGSMEVVSMIALGYAVATLLGWTATEAIFLGAALSISSSAVIVKVLRDNGMLMERHGRLIVGVLVVEDFAAVLLLSVLTGVATTGTASVGEITDLMAKLGVFFVCSLFAGALAAPRIINFVASFKSREALLITSLAMCFGLALIGETLGTSAAAGAFIIGSVLGDSEHSESLKETMAPVRDVVAALFFVSIGMLIDLTLLARYIAPSLIIAGVFMAGKTIAITLGTFLTGHGGKTSLGVGMGTPQMGEFSLAMTKVGADHAVVGAFLYPVVAAASAITSLFYPWMARSSTNAGAFIERRSPRLAQRFVGNLSRALISMRAVFGLEKSEFGRQVRRHGRVIIANCGVMVVTISVGTFALNSAPDMARAVGLSQSVLGIAISCVVIVFCIPPSVFIWRALHRMTDEFSTSILRFEASHFNLLGHTDLHLGKADLHDILQYGILILLMGVLAVCSLPFISRLVIIGSFSTPIAIVILLGLAALMWRVAFKMHRAMEMVFSRTFLGDDD